jgi:hypothetical protein
MTICKTEEIPITGEMMALITVKGMVVGEEPVERHTRDGDKFATLRISEGRKRKDGSYDNAYYDVTVYGEQADFALGLGRKDRIEIENAVLFFVEKETNSGHTVEYKKITVNDRSNIKPWIFDSSQAHEERQAQTPPVSPMTQETLAENDVPF